MMMATQKTLSETKEWRRDGATIYVLNDDGVNHWSLSVQPAGPGSASQKEREDVAAMIQAVPHLINAWTELVSLAERQRYMGVGKAIDSVRHHLLKAMEAADATGLNRDPQQPPSPTRAEGER
jgi:hypothetical protein